MELEALLLGLEPLTALAVGVGAIILAPVVNSVISGSGKDSNSNIVESLTESTKELTKNGLVWGFEALETVQATYAQAEESFRDLLADAKNEQMLKKTQSQKAEPHQMKIVTEEVHY